MSVNVMSKRSMIVLVASWDTAPDALRAASDLLDLRRQHPRAGEPGDEVLGIWCRPALDGKLPLRHRCDAAPSSGIGVRESFALAGLWSLCWIDGPLFEDTNSPEERRVRLLDTLVERDPESAACGTRRAFAPVFEAHETNASIRSSLRDLQERFPRLVRNTWFVDHCDHGLTSAEDL
jgi:hypothetical protein